MIVWRDEWFEVGQWNHKERFLDEVAFMVHVVGRGTEGFSRSTSSEAATEAVSEITDPDKLTSHRPNKKPVCRTGSFLASSLSLLADHGGLELLEAVAHLLLQRSNLVKSSLQFALQRPALPD